MNSEYASGLIEERNWTLFLVLTPTPKLRHPTTEPLLREPKRKGQLLPYVHVQSCRQSVYEVIENGNGVDASWAGASVPNGTDE